MRTVYGDHQRFIDTYFSTFDNVYFTGDGVRRDDDGYYWITGRVDDVINVSGHRLGTAEIESALVSHELVAEAAVVGFPHDIKGQGIYAYVTLNAGIEGNEELNESLLICSVEEMFDQLSPYEEIGIDRLILNMNFGASHEDTCLLYTSDAADE